MKSFKEWVANRAFFSNPTPHWFNHLMISMQSETKSAEQNGDIAKLMQIQSELEKVKQFASSNNLDWMNEPEYSNKLEKNISMVQNAINLFKSKGHSYPGGGG